jgi:hypothetical protein
MHNIETPDLPDEVYEMRNEFLKTMEGEMEFGGMTSEKKDRGRAKDKTK